MNPNIMDLAEYGLMKLAEELEEEETFDLSDLDDEELLALALGLDDDDLEKEAATSVGLAGRRLASLLSGSRARGLREAVEVLGEPLAVPAPSTLLRHRILRRLGFTPQVDVARARLAAKAAKREELLSELQKELARERRLVLRTRGAAIGGVGALGAGGYALRRRRRRR